MEISIGVWGQDVNFSKIADDTNSRNVFVQSVTNIVKSKEFHGLHVLWEWPGLKEENQEKDKKNFILLLEDLSKVKLLQFIFALINVLGF